MNKRKVKKKVVKKPVKKVKKPIKKTPKKTKVVKKSVKKLSTKTKSVKKPKVTKKVSKKPKKGVTYTLLFTEVQASGARAEEIDGFDTEDEAEKYYSKKLKPYGRRMVDILEKKS